MSEAEFEAYIASESSDSMTIEDYYSKAIFLIEYNYHIMVDDKYPILKLFNQLDELERYHDKLNKDRDKKK